MNNSSYIYSVIDKEVEGKGTVGEIKERADKLVVAATFSATLLL